MREQQNTSLIQVVYTHFVPCIFVGIALLYSINGLLPDNSLAGLSDNDFSAFDLILAVGNGLLVAAVVTAYHLRRNKRLKRVNAISRLPASPRTMQHAAIAAVISGGFGVTLLLHTQGIIFITAVVMLILFWHLRAFSKTITGMLHPKAVATWGDVAELARIYLTMLAGFTLLNATMEGARLMAGYEAPFGFMKGGDIFLNSLYYTVVTMTSLGYGDIVPHTWDAKLLVIMESLVSYVMFALVIGIITRGVIRAKDAGVE